MREIYAADGGGYISTIHGLSLTHYKRRDTMQWSPRSGGTPQASPVAGLAPIRFLLEVQAADSPPTIPNERD